MAQSEGFRQITILSGQTDSEEVGVPGGYDMVGVLAPAVLPETVNVKVAEMTGGTYRMLQSGGTDIVIAAGKAITFTQMPFTTFRLVATAGVGADRVFQVVMKRR